MMPVSDAAKAAILNAISQELAPMRISGIEVTPAQDHDGEEILRIVVLLEDDKVVVDGRKLMSASVRAQKALGEIDDDRFALIDFASASEIDQAVE